MPLIHLDDNATDVLEVEEQAPPEHMFTTRDLPRETPATPMAKQPDAIDLAMEALTAAVASGNVDAISAAQHALESARDEAMRSAQRRKDLVLAEQKANAQKAAAKKAAAVALADQVERRVRAKQPTVVFAAPGKRTITIKLGGLGNEPMYATECIRRIAHRLNLALAEQILASRNAGRGIPLGDYLTPMIDDETGGIALYVRTGIAKITRSK